MTREMKIRYAYFLTSMYSGNTSGSQWSGCYELWSNLIGSPDYDDIILRVKKFENDYLKLRKQYEDKKWLC